MKSFTASMPQASHFPYLQSLLDLGLITALQRDKALAHHDVDELGAVTGPSDALVWLVVRDVLPEEEFHAVRSDLRRRFSGDEYRRREDICSGALESVRLVKQDLSIKALKPLLEEGLIDEVQYTAALDALPMGHALASPAAAMVWMVAVAEVITWGHWQALHDKEGPGESLAPVNVRQQILAEADQLLNRLLRASHSAGGILVGWPWLWIGAALLAVAGGLWYLFQPSPVPKCSSDQIVSAVNSMIFVTHIQLRSDITHGGQNLPASGPRLKDVREVGYAKADRSRGCAAVLDYGNSRLPYAFTVKAGGGKKDKESRDAFVVMGADRRMVEARYGRIDEQGNYAQQAAPIGRANLEKAFRSGAESFNLNVRDSARDRLLQGVMGRRQQLRREGSADPDRQREIPDVEPLQPCREVAAPTRYACRLLVERHDPLLQAMGRRGSQLLEADFTFERDGGAGEWRMSEEFPREFAEAIAKARFAALNGSQPNEAVAAKAQASASTKSPP